jgi:hypothetical protein
VIPKPLRDALSFLAVHEQVDLLTVSLKEELAGDIFDLDLDLEHPPAIDWSEGVDKYKDCTPKELWELLGRPSERSVPFFNPRQDVDGHHDSWSEEGAKWFQDPSNGEPLTLHWHQLVGVLKMLDNVFLNKSILLMDGVRLGKTIQTAAFIAFLSWYRDHFTAQGKFPGKFGRCSSPSWLETEEDLWTLRKRIVKFLTGFEQIYIGDNPENNHRARLCVFQIIHVPVHIEWNGSIRTGSQATVERTIGKMGQKIKSR